ncbi:molecular chaperone GrpE [Paenibacillus sp. UNCCL117]|uniref:nucleotide exchange factor GrpE n=1 Tax=unclassified Paenibacillus TaxID=185978 RepID=UPI00088320E8|nr:MULTISPECIES: nucleotide exchange factor GrpE [unclassified Paenibacillus]SDC71320.1 molecular chaperone GrpE [Paenibacillus sp. cl123]SFW24437.1 molecular chaperone GrpE [Paenibacillus sp. UNCCL117]
MNTEQHNQPQSGEQQTDTNEQAERATYEAPESEQANSGHAETTQSDDAVQAQLEEAKNQAEEHYQRLLRTQADFDNFRRRTQKEKEDQAKYASLKVIEQLLPVVDNFDRALSASKENKDYDALAKGIDMIFRQLEQVLTAEGLKPMEVVGQPFNPEFHQAIMQVESEEHEEGIVVEEIQKGYLLKDKVLRPAMVKVSS